MNYRVVFVFVFSLFIGCDDFVVLPEDLANRIGGDLADQCNGTLGNPPEDGEPGCSVEDLEALFILIDEEPSYTEIPRVNFLVNGIQARIPDSDPDDSQTQTNNGLNFLKDNLANVLNNRLSNGPGDNPHICIPALANGAANVNFDDVFGVDSLGLKILVCPLEPFEPEGSAPSMCDGAPGCRVDLHFDSFFLSPQDTNNSDFDEIEARVNLDFGVGVATEETGSCVLEPDIKTSCNGNDCNCADGTVKVNVIEPDIIEDEFRTCEIVLGARDLGIGINLKFGTDSSVFNNAHRELIVDATANILANPTHLADRNIIDGSIFSINRGGVVAHPKCLRLRNLVFLGKFFNADAFNKALSKQIEDAIEKKLIGTRINHTAEPEGNLPHIKKRIDFEGPDGRGLGEVIRTNTTGFPRDNPILDLNGLFDFHISSGDYAVAEKSLGIFDNEPGSFQNGLSFGIRAVVNSDFDTTDDNPSTSSNCIIQRPPPLPGSEVGSSLPGLNNGERIINRVEAFASNTFLSTSIPGPGQLKTYDFGLGISNGTLDIIGYHLYNSGLLCLNEIGLKTESNFANIEEQILTTDIIVDEQGDDDVFPSIEDLIDVLNGPLDVFKTFPLFITVEPNNPPRFSIGDGTSFNDPRIKILLEDFDIEVGMLTSEESKGTLFRARINGTVGFNIEVESQFGNPRDSFIFTLDTEILNPDNIDIELVKIDDNCADNDTNINCFSTLLTETKGEVIKAVPIFLVELFTKINETFLGEIKAPAVAGLEFDLNETEIQKVVDVNSPDVEFLGLFAKLKFTGPTTASLLTPVKTKAKVIRFHPKQSETGVASWPGVELELDGETPGGGKEFEWQIRVDRGMWRSFTSNANLLLRDPRFLNYGDHTLEVRARQRGVPRSLDKNPVVLSVSLGKLRGVVENPGEVPAPGAERTQSCAVSPVSSGSSPILFLIVALCWLLSREKRVRSKKPVALLLGFLWFFPGCFSSPQPAAQEKEMASHQFSGHGGGNHGNGNGNISCQSEVDCSALHCSRRLVPSCQLDLDEPSEPGTCRCVRPEPLPEGDIGAYLDLDVFEGKAYLVAYNSTYGDLMFAKITAKAKSLHGGNSGNSEPAEPIRFLFVDGVPDGPVVGKQNGPRHGVEEPGPEVGRYASIAVDSQGYAHIAYFDETNGNLKYARIGQSGKRVQTVLTIDNDPGVVGKFTDIAIGPGGLPQIAYMAARVTETTTQGPQLVSQLRFLRATANLPFSSSDWSSPVVIDSLPVTLETAPGIALPPLGVGLDTSMTLAQDGKTFILYYDSMNSDSKLAIADTNGSNFNVSTLDNNITNTGQHAYILQNSQNNDFNYTMKSNGKLIYFKNNITDLEVVDDSLRQNVEGKQIRHHVGAYASILTTEVEGAEDIFVVYQEGSDSDVVIAKRHPTAWTRTTLSGNESQFEGAKGFFVSSVLSDIEPQEAVIANYVITPGSQNNYVEIFKILLSDIP